MSLTNSVTDRYRTATDRLVETNWTEGAGIVAFTAGGIALWFLYILVFMIDPDTSGEINTLSLGTDRLFDAIFLSLFVGIVLGPIVALFCRAIGSRLPLRRGYADVVALWTLVCPVGVGLVLWSTRPAGGYLFHYSIPEFAWFIAGYVAVATLLALFAGSVYALASGSIQPSRRQRRALFAVVLVLIAVPLAVGAAYPADDTDDGFDQSEIESTDSDELTDAIEPVDDEDDRDSGEPSSEENETENSGSADDRQQEFHTTTLDEVTCDVTADLPDDPGTDYAVAETDTFEESEISVRYTDFDMNHNSETVTIRSYAFEFDNYGKMVGVQTAVESDSYHSWIPLSDGLEVNAQTDAETRMWIDAVNDDGEVVRYQFDVCPSEEGA